MMETIFFYFRETPIDINNKFTLNFSNTELISQIIFSTKNDYYITTTNCNLAIANDLDDRLKNIKELSEKGCLLLEKGPAYQFDLCQIQLPFFRQGLERNFSNLYLLSYPEKIDFYSWKYKFYDIKDNLIKD